MRNIVRFAAACLVVALLGRTALAQSAPKKGEKASLSFTAVDGTKVDLADLQGKLVLVDFWATWCGPCMAEADHMVKTNAQYGGKGLVILGISLDTDVEKMKKVAKEKGFSWLQCCDGKMWDTPIAKAWGVNGIPHTFLFGPDGTLLWDGHPATMDKPIADAMKNHPPSLVDMSVMNQAGAALDEMEAAIKSHDAMAAVKAMAKFPAEAAKEAKFADRFAVDQKEIQAMSDALLADVDAMVSQKQYVQAEARYKELMIALPGTPTAKTASQKLQSLSSDPAIKAQIDAADKTAKADAALAIAQKLKAEKKDDQAYPRFKEIVVNFTQTPAAATAAQVVQEYEKDAAFMARISQNASATKAKAALNLADNYRAAGNEELARKKYQDVVHLYPNTDFAKSAQKALDEMNGN